jgi:hypothetical protein
MTCIVVKISIIITLLRLTINRIHIWILYATISFASGAGLVFLFFIIFQCSPVDYFWDQSGTAETGTCISKDLLINIAYFYSASAAVTDLTIALVPVALIWNLRMDRRNKSAVIGILCIGCVFVFPLLYPFTILESSNQILQCKCSGRYTYTFSSQL